MPAIVAGGGPRTAQSPRDDQQRETRRGADVRYAFPTAHDITRLRPEKYRAIGFSRQKVRALLDLARAITRQELDLESVASEDDAVAQQRLLELRGVGRWTAEYVLLRGLGRLHVFPGDDVGAQKRLARWLGRSRPLDYAGVHRAVERWQPYAGLVYFHLLLDGLSQAGALGIETRSRLVIACAACEVVDFPFTSPEDRVE